MASDLRKPEGIQGVDKVLSLDNYEKRYGKTQLTSSCQNMVGLFLSLLYPTKSILRTLHTTLCTRRGAKGTQLNKIMVL